MKNTTRTLGPLQSVASDTATRSYGFAPAISLAVGLGSVAVLASSVALAASRPAPLPMLSGPTGAKPNVMLAMESTNNLANPFTLTYKITGKNKPPKRLYCKNPTYNNGYADEDNPVLNYGANGTKCRKKGGLLLASYFEVPTKDFEWRFDIEANAEWYAMRSSDVNPVFYNPRLTYKPRLVPGVTGPVVKNDPVDQVNDTTLVNDVLVNDNLFVSNDTTTSFAYCSSNNPGSDRFIKSWRETPGMPPASRAAGACTLYLSSLNKGIEEGVLSPAGNHQGNSTPQHWMEDKGSLEVPKLNVTTSPNASTPSFTYAFCAQPLYDYPNIGGEPWNQEVGCRVGDMLKPRNDFNGTLDIVEVKYGGPNIPLRAGHQRTDCAGGLSATTCTSQEEMRNIANWYRWYNNQTSAIATSVGRVLANRDYQEKMRVGYFRSLEESARVGTDLVFGNYNDDGIGTSDGRQTSSLPRTRGVRLLGQDAASKSDSDQVFDWLYRWMDKPNGRKRTLHHTLNEVAKYYKVTNSGQQENPWAKDPSQMHSASNPELTCRRSFTILASALGGEYRAEDFTGGSVETKAWDKKPGNLFPSPYYGPNFDFVGYNLKGDNRNQYSRKLYTPFGNYNFSAIGGDDSDLSMRLAKKTARYYWHEDFRPTLANEVAPRNGQPIAWQNMTTYTLGYNMKPSLEMANSIGRGLSYNQIEQFKRDWALGSGGGFDAMPKPKWVARDAIMASSSGSVGFIGNPRGLADDFIQAGYTGGGAGFGVSTPAEVERAFDTIISEIINYRGNDAGVAVTGLSATTTETLVDNTKLTINYDLTQNSGLLSAVKLDQYGNNDTALWNTAETGKFPAVASRKFFTLTAAKVAKTITQTSTVTDFGFTAAELSTAGTDVDANSSNFSQYLLGDDTKANKNGGLWRQRSQPMASSVNSAPLYIRARLNMGYGNATADVAGASTYSAYFKNKYNRPGTLYLATNQGLVHVFNAGDTDKPYTGFTGGQEVGAYLLRGSANKLPKFADSAYKFQYMADGPLVEHDVYDGGNWKNMVFGTLGRGGNGMFAFNTKLNATAPTPAQSDFAWEKTANDGADYANFGSITNNPQGGMNDVGTPMLVTNSGHYASSGTRGLYILNPVDGSKLAFIATTGSGRGLGGVTLIRDAKKRITGAYAGDESGNLWRFHLAGASATWGVRKLYSTGGLPIYAAPAWQTHPGKSGDACQSTTSSGACGAIVVIGTGILLDEDDQGSTTKQRLVGIWDTTPVDGSDAGFSKTSATFSGLTNLLEQSIKVADGKAGLGRAAADTFYPVTQNKIDWATHKGWYLNLDRLANTKGERVIGDLMNIGSSVFATSVVIDTKDVNAEQCSAGPGGTINLIYGVDALSGGLKRSFDQNADGRPDAFSVVYTPAGGFTRNNALTQVIAPPPNASIDLLDHFLAKAGGDPKEGKPDEKVQTTGGAKAVLTGTQNSIKLYDGKLSGWRRNWRQIINLPSTLR